MNRKQVIKEIQDKAYFKIEELVCPHIIARHGRERAWMFLPTIFLHTLLVIRRDIIQEPMIINNHRVGGNFTQRGVRCCQCQLVKSKTYAYMSAHVLAMACDSHCLKMTAQQMRDKIIEKQYLLPYPIRLEDKVNWLHFDCYDPTNGEKKVTLFNP